MSQRSMTFLLFSAAFSASTPAAAQEIIGTPEAAFPSPSGYQIDETASGFQLVTHGMWRVLERPLHSPDSTPPDRHRKASRSTPGTADIVGANNFRRAIYLPHVRKAEQQYGLPMGLLDALIWTESRYNPLAVSRAGAAGLGQLMPKTAQDLGVANRFDPTANLWASARYLRQMLDRFGVVHLAVAAYNAGPGAVARVGGIPLNGETPSYVRDVLAFWGAK